MSEGRWVLGEAEVQNLIDQGELDEVEPSSEHAELLMQQAETHLVSAPALLPADPPGAYSVLYDAARKSLSAVLAKQGLRATSKNGHRATQQAIEAQLGPNASKVVRPFRNLRSRRHEAEYPALETPAVTTQEVEEALADAREMVAAMKKFLPNVGAWQS